MRPFITSEVFREKVVRKVERYFAWLSDTVDAHVVDAPMHLIESEHALSGYRDESGRVVASSARGRGDAGRLTTHAGRGDNTGALAHLHVEHNAALLARILASR